MRKRKSRVLVLPELSFKVVGALFSVHRELGPTMLERHYQRALMKEFDNLNISYKKEVPVNLDYKGENVGKYYLDFIVEDCLILETKAQRSYSPQFFKQVLAYLRQTHLPLAILANFRRPSLEYKRIVNSEFKDHPFETNSNKN